MQSADALVHVLLRRIVSVERHEVRALVLSFVYFLVLLTSYSVLRPIRNAMAVEAGERAFPWLVSGIFIAMLAIVPAFGWVAARLPARRLVPCVYLFFAGNLILFYLAMAVGASRAVLAPAFFGWLSVFNLFVVSVFWSVMADLFSTETARRLFGFIAAGGTCGATAGPLVTALAVRVV